MKYSEKFFNDFITWDLKSYRGANNFTTSFLMLLMLLLLIVMFIIIFINIF